MSSERRLLLLLLATFVYQILLKVRGQEYHCIDTGNNYTSNGTYNSNLNTLPYSLSTNMDANGFNGSSFGQTPDTVHAIALCRGDIQGDACRNCVQYAATEVLRLCPNYQQAVHWNALCMVRYSNAPIAGILSATPGSDLHSCWNVTSSPDEFMENVRTLLDDLRAQAAYRGNTLQKVAGGTTTWADNLQPIYGLVQCSPDLSPNDCNTCLANATVDMLGCCSRRMGARILRPSCILRYEITPFYDGTRLPQDQDVSPPRPKGNLVKIIKIAVPVVATVILAIFVAFLVRWRMKPVNEHEAEDIFKSLQYDFDKIRAATNDFSESNKLGEGGFGSVYKGLVDGQEVAVKRLSKNSSQGVLEFKNEVMLLTRLTHRNLVRLLGFSLQGTEKLLVYELLPNASLEKFIFEPTEQSRLDWHKRYKIIIGIAKGLLYLHEDSQMKIIHRDLKLSNILLDGDMNPKIADFGMARLFVPDETHVLTKRIVGTYGYMAPEYAIQGQFSVKSDVFSFGVLVLEIISGRKNITFRNSENVEDLLISIAWKCWRDGTPANVINHVLKSNSGTLHEILRFVQIGLLCVQGNAAARPTIASIFLMLSSDTTTLSIPSPPAYFLPEECNYEVINSVDSNASPDVAASLSANDMSISEFHPR